MSEKRNIRSYITEELSGWKKWEVIWLLVSCAVIFALSVYWKDSVMGIISATTGVACVVFTGKGKLSSFLFGMVNSLLYAIISYEAKFYGEVMLNALYYFPMQFYGLYVWSKHMNAETHEVIKKEMSVRGKIILGLSVTGATIVYGFILKALGGTMPFIDALSTVISVVTLVISIKMYAEQWMLWIVVDAVTVVMWAISFAQGGESIATLLMWVLFLINGVVMHIKWTKEARLTM